MYAWKLGAVQISIHRVDRTETAHSFLIKSIASPGIEVKQLAVSQNNELTNACQYNDNLRSITSANSTHTHTILPFTGIKVRILLFPLTAWGRVSRSDHG